MNKGKLRNTLLAGAALLLSSVAPLQAATTADVLFVVDESGSMSGEHGWISNMVTSLDNALGLAGVTNNQYALVGFGGRAPHLAGHTHDVNGTDFGTAAQLATATGSLVLNGGTEDGYSGITHALTNYKFRPGAAVNVILVTDEDRDTIDSSLTFASVLKLLKGQNALLNAVVNSTFGTAQDNNALGIAKSPTQGYYADGAGGYNIGAGGALIGSGSTIKDYVDLALATGGAAWNLNKLRAGGLIADSFTKAFVDIKVGEIIVQPPGGGEVPIPAAVFMFAPALLGFLGLRRRAKATVA